MKTKILVKAPVLSRSGYGEHARFIIRSLRSESEKYEVYIQNINWGATGWIHEDNEEREWIDKRIKKTLEFASKKQIFDMSIQVTIPQEWEKIAKINIGATAGTETTRISPEWIEASNKMDKIIFVSNHAKMAFEKTAYEARNEETGEIIKDFRCMVPMSVVNFPVRYYEPEKIDLGLEYDFNFLAIAQYSPRKNLERTVEWLVEEFYDQKIGIVLKINFKNDSTIDRYLTEDRLRAQLNQSYPDRKCKVYLLHGNLTNEQLSGLYQNDKIKALVSLSHGEGFGLPMFEASYYGLPVICPDWGGQLDFLYIPVTNKKGKVKNKAHFVKVDYDLKKIHKDAVWEPVLIKESSWCYPKQGSFKMKCRELKKNYSTYKSKAEKLQNYILVNFAKEEKYKEFNSHLDEFIIPEAPQKEVDSMFEDLLKEAK